MKHFLFAAAGLAALCAHAQQDAVVVTATRFPERALDAPVGMRIIGARDIEASAAATLPEALVKLGGLHGRNLTGAPDLQLDLRGYGITGDQNTLVLLDGVRMNSNDLSSTQLTAIPLHAIERIEIVPGSGSVLYGGGATAGTINIVTKEPRLRSRSAYVLGGVGSYGTSDLRASVNAGGESVGLALHAGRFATQGYRANNELRQDSVLGDVRLGQGRLQAGLRFGSDWQRLRLPGERNQNELERDPRGTSKPHDFNDRDGDLAVLYARYSGDRIDLAADVVTRGSIADTRNTTPFGFLYADIKQRVHAFSPRMRIALEPLGMRSSLVVGADFSDADYRRRTWTAYSPAGAPAGTNVTTQSSRAAYAQYNTELSPSLKATAGWRHQRVADGNDITFFGPLATGARKHAVNAGELGLRWAVSERLSAFARAGTSFRLATADDNAQTATGQLLDPQKARHREAGVEYGRARLTVYRTDLENEIYFSPLVVPFGANTNLSPTRREGVEAEAGWRPATAWDVGARLALQSAKFTSGTYGGIDVSGREVPLVPHALAGLRVSWAATQSTRVAGSATHVARQRYDNDQDNRFPLLMPAYTLVDVKLLHDMRDWRIAASVNNLLDREYYSYGIVNAFNCATPICAYPQAGRSFFVSLERTLR